MFWMQFMPGNSLLWASLSMDYFNVMDQMGAWECIYIFPTIYPAFMWSYCKREDMPVLLGACNGLRALGDFLQWSRWPNQLLCGDPMACWRSQYLFSHAIFYNTAGDGGNITYVNWYLCVKSQRRQCCCPYRKLKSEAPEKCCPPCCLGPLVEKEGGCPCPCCCASCSSSTTGY